MVATETSAVGGEKEGRGKEERIEGTEKGWRDGAGVKSIGRSSREPGFGS